MGGFGSGRRGGCGTIEDGYTHSGQIPGQRRNGSRSVPLSEPKIECKLRPVEWDANSDLCSAAPACPDFCPGYGYTLDMSRCLKLRWLLPGSHVQGSIQWTRSITGAAVASISYQADMRDPEDAWLRLTYSIIRHGETTKLDYRVVLCATQPHFGGVRWWFRCPESYRRVRCLRLVGQSERFACRQFLKLGYRVQRETWSDQQLRAAQAVDAKLGGTSNLMAGPPLKPKWMRWPTYWRLVEERKRASLRSLIGFAVAYDTPGMRAIVDDALRDDPSLLPDGRRR